MKKNSLRRRKRIDWSETRASHAINSKCAQMASSGAFTSSSDATSELTHAASIQAAAASLLIETSQPAFPPEKD
ncbi:hypothetical protein Spb1_07260 [Planctopirus ephydatiae]|uniref:Uncharacterized protein n=1 Tax=Planctopirus ephydatiae TaxID=2528019 RepID=A0A518GJU8_9PLAN|nr:hypothetical protein Spb1_07260 [Planctopirus ephydatiae]